MKLISKKILHDFAILVGIGVFIGVLSPFGMNDEPLYWSIIYWVTLSIIGYVIFVPCINVCELKLKTIISPHWLRISAGALIASIIMSFIVPFITSLLTEYPINVFGKFFFIFPNVLTIGAVITLVYVLVEKYKTKSAELNASQQTIETQKQALTEVKSGTATQLIEKLSIDKQGELICLEMSDHYVKVYTDRGHEMLLMRFKDALKELNDYAGLQTHRSWWVATSAVTASFKQNRKTLLRLSNGIEVPVSRTYLEQVKTAGLI